MSDLKGSECLSVEEYAAVFQDYPGWERRLVENAATKESCIVEKIASVIGKYVPSSEEARKLKGTMLLKIDVFYIVYADFYTSLLVYILYVFNVRMPRYLCIWECLQRRYKITITIQV